MNTYVFLLAVVGGNEMPTSTSMNVGIGSGTFLARGGSSTRFIEVNKWFTVAMVDYLGGSCSGVCGTALASKGSSTWI